MKVTESRDKFASKLSENVSFTQLCSRKHFPNCSSEYWVPQSMLGASEFFVLFLICSSTEGLKQFTASFFE